MREQREGSGRLSRIFILKDQWGCLDFSRALPVFDFTLFSLIFGAIESKVAVSTTPSGIPCLTL